jgi:tRNA-splicing ligase RtcB
MGRKKNKDDPSKVSPVTPSPKISEDLSPSKQLRRTFDQEAAFLSKLNPTQYQLDIGFVDNMRVPAQVFVNEDLEQLLLEELRASTNGDKGGGFLPALKQVANVAALPGIVKASLAMPDVHSGYGFCIGGVAAFDLDDPDAVVSPGGVGFDINCG